MMHPSLIPVGHHEWSKHERLNGEEGPTRREEERDRPETPADTGRDSGPGAGPDSERGASTAVKKRPSRPKSDRMPPFKVLLHNDDVNEMIYVVESISMLTPHDRASATKVMIEAHTSGVALVLTTHKERAELYEEQFRSRHLLVTVEPAE